MRIAGQALDEAERLEQQLTIFRENSEVSAINRNAASQPVRVEPSLFELLLLCRELSRATAGAFDVTAGPLSRSWGFVKRAGRIPDQRELEEAKSLVGIDKLLLNSESRTVQFERPGMELNLGSIGKGYALDRLAATIRRRVRTALLSAGSSSMCAVGAGDDGRRGWLVGIRHPRNKDRRLATLRLCDTALSTSGSEEQFFEHGGQRYGHVIDPRTGLPAQRVTGVTVIAPSAAVADALATAFYVGGPELAEHYFSAHPEILVVMLEEGSERPIVFGDQDRYEMEIIDG